MPGGGRASHHAPDNAPNGFDLAWVPQMPSQAAGDGDDKGNPRGKGQKKAAEPPSPMQECLAKCDGARLAMSDAIKFASMGQAGEVQVQPEWPQSRQFCGRIISSNLFVFSMGIIICFNIVIVLVEADRRAQCVDPKSQDCSANDADVRISDRVCSIIYIIELLMRIYVWQKRFCCSFWNVTDAIVVLISVAGELFQNWIQNAALIRLVRIVRIVKILRVVTMFQELYLMIASLASTMRTIFWACIMLVLVISIMSLLAVEMLHPLQKEMMEDPQDFNSITSSMTTFFATIIMGDGIFDVFVPLIEKDWYAACFILTCVALVYLGFSNLVLSVIVDKANEARCNDATYQAMLTRRLRDQAQKELLTLWQEVDIDGSNTVTLEELREIHETSANFKVYFKSHNIDMELLTYAFSVMDPDGDGHCNFNEFAETLVRLKSTDAGPATAYMKHQMGKVVAELGQIKDLLKKTEQVPLVPIQEHCDDASDTFTLASKPESKSAQGITASLDESLRSVADLVANAIPAMDTVVHGPVSPVEMDPPPTFDFASPTPAGSGYAGSEPVTPSTPQQKTALQQKLTWRLLSSGPSKQQMRNQSPSEAADELVELLKYAYEGTQPLNLQYLRGLEWHYADLCQRVEVQLGRLMAIVQDSELRARMELFCCSARLISSLGAAMPRILPDPSSSSIAQAAHGHFSGGSFSQGHISGGHGSETEGTNLPEPPQNLNVHPNLHHRLEFEL